MIKKIIILLFAVAAVSLFSACHRLPEIPAGSEALKETRKGSSEQIETVTDAGPQETTGTAAPTPIQPRTEPFKFPVDTKAPAVTTAPQIKPQEKDGTLPEQVAALVNEERAKAGLPPLTLDAALSQNADVRADEIVRSFSHTRPDGRSAMTAITAPYRTAGENIAAGQRTAAEVMTAWMNSEGHRANILNRAYSKIGVGVAEDGGRLFWVQLFVG